MARPLRIEYVAKAVARYELKIHTNCLMTNHYHFLIETPHPNPSQAIKWINVGYVAHFTENVDVRDICSKGGLKPC